MINGGGDLRGEKGGVSRGGPKPQPQPPLATLERKNQIFKLEGKGLRRGKRWEILASTYALLPGGFSSCKKRGGEEGSECMLAANWIRESGSTTCHLRNEVFFSILGVRPFSTT